MKNIFIRTVFSIVLFLSLTVVVSAAEVLLAEYDFGVGKTPVQQAAGVSFSDDFTVYNKTEYNISVDRTEDGFLTVRCYGTSVGNNQIYGYFSINPDEGKTIRITKLVIEHQKVPDSNTNRSRCYLLNFGGGEPNYIDSQYILTNLIHTGSGSGGKEIPADLTVETIIPNVIADFNNKSYMSLFATQNTNDNTNLSQWKIKNLKFYGEVIEGTPEVDAYVFSPRFNATEFINPGGTFDVEVSESAEATGWTATLSNDIQTWNCEVVSATYSKIKYDLTNGWQLKVKAPIGIPPELMHLNLTSSEGEIGAERAVSVVDDFDTSFYILHMSDQHYQRKVAKNANGTDEKSSGSQEQIIWTTEPVNLINPRFIAITGDNFQNYHEPDLHVNFAEAKQRMLDYIAGSSGYQVPILLVNGNHDMGFDSYVDIEEYRQLYEQYFGGPRVFGRYIGKFFVAGAEWVTPQYTNWVKKVWNDAYADTSVGFRLYLMHYVTGEPGVNTQVPDAEKPADLMLIGHGHSHKIQQAPPQFPYYALMAPSMFNTYYKAPFHNFVKSGDKWTCPDVPTYTSNNKAERLYDDWGAPRVAASYAEENDGTSISNTVTITNKNKLNYYDGRVRFLMKRGSYDVVGGNKIAAYDYGDNSTAVLVQVDIPEATSSASTKVVSIASNSTAIASPSVNTKKLTIYQNQANQTIVLQANKSMDSNMYVQIMNLSGVTVKSDCLPASGNSFIDVSGLKKGVYFVNASIDAASITEKIILL